jgi:hypothetical protein
MSMRIQCDGCNSGNLIVLSMKAVQFNEEVFHTAGEITHDYDFCEICASKYGFSQAFKNLWKS